MLVVCDIYNKSSYAKVCVYGLLQLYKLYSTHKQVYAHAQRLGLQSARSAQRGKQNRALTLPRFHL